MNRGQKITIVGGSRLRRISEDGKTLLDQKPHEGALVDRDILGVVEHVVASADKKMTAIVMKVPIDGKQLVGWCFLYEIAPAAPIEA